MSLYRYVAAKDELLALMVDAALDRPPPPRAGRGLARRALALGLDATTTRCAATRGSCGCRSAAPPRHAEPGRLAGGRPRARSRGTGLTEPEKLSVILLVSGFVRNEATLAADIAAASPAGPRSCRRGADSSRSVTDPERFPALHAALASEAFEQDDDMDDEFVSGLSASSTASTRSSCACSGCSRW